MERKNIIQFKEWKNSPNRKPLIVLGARQIGKTYSVLDFGKTEYENVVYCNFESEPDLSQLFQGRIDPEEIITNLSIVKSTEIKKSSTLIFFDEIQACEKALTSLKYFCEQANDYHIVGAGSLLGIAVNRGDFSFPVGKVDILNLYPMTSDEFLMATGNYNLISIIEEHFLNFTPMPEPVHQKALDLYRTFLVVGGYPEAVKAYLESGDFNLVRSVQNNISDAYLADMSKYANPTDTVKAMSIFNSVHSQLAKENTKFQYSAVKSGARSKDYEVSLMWLEKANVILKCHCVTEGKYPVNIYEDLNAFKLYYSDVGLLSMRMGVNPQAVIHNINISDKANGMMAENYVAQELSAKGEKLFYWTSGNSAEVDFVYQDDSVQSVIPLETKSGENVRAKSFNMFMKKYDSEYGVRVSARNFGFEGKVKSVPLYSLFCL